MNSTKLDFALYLIPCSIGENSPDQLPKASLEILDSLDFFIVERARTARRFIKACFADKAIDALEIFEFDKHDPEQGLEPFLQKMQEENRPAGLLSEAGSPGVADPGQGLVRIAHQKGIPVIPLVGPSSILLALMASGMNGQSFAFHGYLPVKKPELQKALKSLEERVAQSGQTQIFIEAPYRNQQLLATAVSCLKPETNLAMAIDLTLPEEQILSQPISKWKNTPTKGFHKRPAVFMIGR
ncbi:MAG: SAM-dependent methyltransferase [Saprospiraceae bacterium]|nr:SAM-dependent methyltransferase [Saprospiraceae bacterium]